MLGIGIDAAEGEVFMEYGDVIVYLTIVALGASVLIIVGLLALLVVKAFQQPPPS
jgi:hypothetical protein